MESIALKCRFSKQMTSTDSGWGVSMYTAKEYSTFPAEVKKKANPGCCYFMAAGTNLPQDKHLDVELTGFWKKSKYGMQFQVKYYNVFIPETKSDIEKYLASGAFPGIGKANAHCIVQMFGTDALNVIREHPEQLLTIRGFTRKSVEKIRQAYVLKTGFQEMSDLLGKYGITGERLNRCYEMFGDEGLAVIKRNPYMLIDVKGISFPMADKVAQGLQLSMDSVKRLTSGVTYTAEKMLYESGSMYCTRDELIDAALNVLNEPLNSPYSLQVSRAQVVSAVEETKGIGTIINRFPRNLDIVYTDRADVAERECALAINGLVKAASHDEALEKSIKEWQEEHSDFTLTRGQKEAVNSIVDNRICVITGGAGVGKTTVAKAILQAYEKAHPEKSITLLAPTGKAAKRLMESTGHSASTIHSALRIRADENQAFSQYLPEGLIIVDETSMVDQFVAQKLFNAIPVGSTVVLLGDINQLPSVGPGQLLAEIIRSGKVKVTYLLEIMRQAEGSTIIENCYLINEGISSLHWDESFRFIPVEREAEDIIVKEYLKEVDEYGMDEVAILCPRRKSGICSDSLNLAIQKALDKGEPYAMAHGQKFREGDRIIQTRNTDIAANGEVGYLVSITEEYTEEGKQTVFHIQFDGVEEMLHYTRKEMENVSLAYAMTIHKSQGSEYKSVIIPLLKSMTCRLYNKALLYTAVSRSKQKCCIIGDQKSINLSVSTNMDSMRRSMLAERIFYGR